MPTLKLQQNLRQNPDGTVALATKPGADSYGVIDEITGRVILAGGKVLAVRRSDMPDGAAVAAILRYPV